MSSVGKSVGLTVYHCKKVRVTNHRLPHHFSGDWVFVIIPVDYHTWPVETLCSTAVLRVVFVGAMGPLVVAHPLYCRMNYIKKKSYMCMICRSVSMGTKQTQKDQWLSDWPGICTNKGSERSQYGCFFLLHSVRDELSEKNCLALFSSFFYICLCIIKLQCQPIRTMMRRISKHFPFKYFQVVLRSGKLFNATPVNSHFEICCFCAYLQAV